MLRPKFFYPLMIILFGSAIWLSILTGFHLFPSAQTPVDSGKSSGFIGALLSHLNSPLAILLLQIVLVVGVARLFAVIFRRLGQPLVIGEIIAGIALGPSLLGWILPESANFFFPKNSMAGLGLVSQIGLILFMFLIGMELDVGKLKNKVESAVVISHSSIILPFLLGTLLSLYLYPRFASPEVSFLSFSLFMGIAMSITAFPVLARILQDHALSSTRTGSMVLACAAADDVTAWSILAVVLALVRSGGVIPGLITLALSLVYIGLMIRFVQPLLKRFSDIYVSRENLSRGALTVLFLFIFSSAFITEMIGIHALFGAFLAGAIMPSGRNLKELFSEKIRDFSMLALLPLFFAFTGLRTSIGLLNSVDMWLVTALIVAVAMFGKMGGSTFAARITGETWRDSLAIGALMNTRGLMELVVLNIGFDLGILSAEIFSMMVLMALATTAITGPLLNLIWKFFPEEEISEGGVMISYATEKSGYALARLSDKIFSAKNLSMLHFSTGSSIPGRILNGDKVDIYDGFNENTEFQKKIKKHVHSIQLVRFVTRPTENILQQIIHEVEREKPGILLVGSARGLFFQNIFGGIIRHLLMRAKCHVGIYTGFDEINTEKVLILSNGGDKVISGLLKSKFKPSRGNVTILPPVQITEERLQDFTFVIIESELYEKWAGSITQPCLIIRLYAGNIEKNS